MTVDTKWLKEVCANVFTRPALSEPMMFHRDGKQFTIATDGYRMVELPGHYGEFKAVPQDILPSVLSYLAPTPDTAVPFDYSAFKEFVQVELKDVTRECAHCENTGEVVYFSSKGAGPNYTTCPVCKGACIASKRAFIGEVLFDVRLFEAMVLNLPTPDIVGWYNANRKAPAIVDGLDWRFIVMPQDEMRLTKEELASYNRFPIPGVKAKAA